MIKRRLTCWGIFLLLIGCLSGCGKEAPESEKTGTGSVQESQVENFEENHTDNETVPESSEVTESTQPKVTEEPKEEIIVQQHEITMADITPADMVADMKVGWNLGNTLDATGGSGLNSETSWGNPKTTKEMIDAIVDAGFNVIRIPITWDRHFGKAPDYKIDEAWLNRVQEVVDYAYERDVYVIINCHHEEWHFPSDKNKEQASEILAALWKQIAERFRDYDERLIFEGLNEPRKKGTPVEWTGGDYESKQVVNHFAKVFVETVRATGGNNTIRNLMVTGYAASSNKETLRSIRLPKDDAHLIVSVHAYTPYDFALNIKGTAEWDVEKDTRDIDYLMETIDELFLQNDIAVIIGEFGALNKENEAERAEWVTYYLTKAKEYGVPCVWWDNGSFSGSGENFGLLNRRELTMAYPELLKAIMDATE